MSVKDWAEGFNARYEEEKAAREIEQDHIDAIEFQKKLVTFRSDALTVELIKAFASAHEASISSVCGEVMSNGIKEAIEAIGGNYDEWVSNAMNKIAEGK